METRVDTIEEMVCPNCGYTITSCNTCGMSFMPKKFLVCSNERHFCCKICEDTALTKEQRGLK